MPGPSVDYKESYLLPLLRDRAEAVAYLKASADEDDAEGFALAVQDIFEAWFPKDLAALKAGASPDSAPPAAPVGSV